jgi:hypothetical protein
VRRLLALVLVAACGSDPVLDPVDDALDAYDDGRAALTRGDAVGARTAFALARSFQPDDPTLAAWEAHAADQAGDVSGALALLNVGVAAWPSSVDLRYNRAALLARTGDVAGAAVDLRVLYKAGVVHPRDAADDPDFAPLAADPTTAGLVPPPALAVTARGEGGAVLLAERWSLEIELRGPTGADLVLQSTGSATPLLRLDKVVEELLPGDARETPRRLRLEYRAVQAGTGTIGPWAAKAGRAAGLVPAQSVEVVPLPGRESGESGPPLAGVPLPSALGPPDPAPMVTQSAVGTVITAPVEATIDVDWSDDAFVAVIHTELRDGDRAVLQRLVVPRHPAGEVRISRAGLDLLQQPLVARPAL